MHHAAFEWALKRAAVLRRVWNVDAIQEDGKVEQDGDGYHESDGRPLRNTSEFIRSPWVWAYAKPIHELSGIVEHVMSWTKACPCHPSCVQDVLRDRPQFASHLICPMRGLRAPELAAGSFDTFMSDLCNVSTQEVALRHTAWLSPDERHRVMTDFETGREHLKMQCLLKASMCSVLPLKILVIGHLDSGMARVGLSAALVMYDNSDQDAQHHPLVELLFGVHRHEVLQFLQGVPRSELPYIRQLRHRFMFTPVNEQSVERWHAEVHNKLYSHHATLHHMSAWWACASRSCSTRFWTRVFELQKMIVVC